MDRIEDEEGNGESDEVHEGEYEEMQDMDAAEYADEPVEGRGEDEKIREIHHNQPT